MQVSRLEKATSRQTRRPNGPACCETIQQITAAARGATVSIQSPHTDAVSVPYRTASTPPCTSMRMAAAATAGVRYLDGCLRLLRPLPPQGGCPFSRPDESRPRVYTDRQIAESSTSGDASLVASLKKDSPPTWAKKLPQPGRL